MIRYYDFRNEAADAVLAGRLGKLRESEGAYVTAWQLAALPHKSWARTMERIVVTVPDFLNYARLLNTGQARQLMGLPGSVTRSIQAGAVAGIRSIPMLGRLAKMDFWSVAQVLLRYDLNLLPSGFRGAVCLHAQLMDFACAFERQDFVRFAFAAGKKRGPCGFHTQQLAATASCLTRWQLQADVLSVLCASGDHDGYDALSAARTGPVLSGSRIIAEMESWPADLQQFDVASHLVGAEISGILVGADTTCVTSSL